MRLHAQLEMDTTYVADLELCQVRLHHNAAFPWLILVPKRLNVTDIHQLPSADRHTLMNEIQLVSSVMQTLFSPYKLNVAALGNIVSQLHIHVIARYQEDAAWPQPVWNSGIQSKYTASELTLRCQNIMTEIQVTQHRATLKESPVIWLLIDFDNTIMATEHLALPSLIQRFNTLYQSQLQSPLTLTEFKTHFHGMSRESLCEKMSEHFKIDVSYPDLYQDREHHLACIMQETKVEFAPGLLECLSTLQENGLVLDKHAVQVKFAVVTNNPLSRAFAALRSHSGAQGDYFLKLIGPHWFEAGDCQKPRPEVYLRAMEALGISPQVCFAIEDSVTGARSSQAAQIRTLGYTGISHAQEALIDAGVMATFADWQELPSLLASLQK